MKSADQTAVDLERRQTAGLAPRPLSTPAKD
jgi:hypothetical protein